MIIIIHWNHPQYPPSQQTFNKKTILSQTNFNITPTKNKQILAHLVTFITVYWTQFHNIAPLNRFSLPLIKTIVPLSPLIYLFLLYTWRRVSFLSKRHRQSLLSVDIWVNRDLAFCQTISTWFSIDIVDNDELTHIMLLVKSDLEQWEDHSSG